MFFQPDAGFEELLASLSISRESRGLPLQKEEPPSEEHLSPQSFALVGPGGRARAVPTVLRPAPPLPSRGLGVIVGAGSSCPGRGSCLFLFALRSPSAPLLSTHCCGRFSPSEAGGPVLSLRRETALGSRRRACWLAGFASRRWFSWFPV